MEPIFKKKQIGFARVVTDYSTFSWVCDVFTDPKYRGKGVGKQLVQSVVNHESLKTGLMILATRDAHYLYSRYEDFRHSKTLSDLCRENHLSLLKSKF